MVHMSCECGCGGIPPLATKTRGHLGTVKGQPIRFIPGHGNFQKTGTPYKKDRYTVEDRGYETQCWIWQLAQTGKGYGCEWDRGRGRMVSAHILAYERAYGPVPHGLELDHLCHVRLCVNPAHLEAVLHAENVRRRLSYETANARKTHCPKGHPYAGDNLYVEVTPHGETRRCRACRGDQQRRRRRRS